MSADLFIVSRKNCFKKSRATFRIEYQCHFYMLKDTIFYFLVRGCCFYIFYKAIVALSCLHCFLRKEWSWNKFDKINILQSRIMLTSTGIMPDQCPWCSTGHTKEASTSYPHTLQHPGYEEQPEQTVWLLQSFFQQHGHWGWGLRISKFPFLYAIFFLLLKF